MKFRKNSREVWLEWRTNRKSAWVQFEKDRIACRGRLPGKICLGKKLELRNNRRIEEKACLFRVCEKQALLILLLVKPALSQQHYRSQLKPANFQNF